MKIIPAIDIQNGNCVRLRQGDFAQETIFDKNPLNIAQKWVDEGAERLHLVDLDGARLGSPINLDIISSICTLRIDSPVALSIGLPVALQPWVCRIHPHSGSIGTSNPTRAKGNTIGNIQRQI